MNLEELVSLEFIISLGYVTLIASILTIFLMQIFKVVLKKNNVITKDMDAIQKDLILSKAGRIIALIIYSIVYLLNDYLLNNAISINESLIVGLVSGSAFTLTVAKGLYTSFRQGQKKKSVFIKLKEAEEIIKQLSSNQKVTEEVEEAIYIIGGNINE